VTATPDNPTPDLAAQLPERFIERLRAVIPVESQGDALASFSAIKPTVFRVNTLQAAAAKVRDELLALGFTLSPIGGIDVAFSVPHAQRRALTQTDAVSDGRIYIQGAASMLAPLVLDPRPGESVLDLCAAPGGKTLMMAAMMGNAGTLNAVEPGKTRFFKLKANLDRGGASMVRVYHTDGRQVGRKTPARFDRILVDAPCAGEARFNTHDPASYADWSEKKVARCARVQKALLRSALDAVMPGGVVLYCTCSMSVEENEGVVKHTLKRMGDAIALEPVRDLPAAVATCPAQAGDGPLVDALARCIRVLPAKTHDAFFLALVRRRV